MRTKNHPAEMRSLRGKPDSVTIWALTVGRRITMAWEGSTHMRKHQGDSGREAVGVHVRLDKVVLAYTGHDPAGVSIPLTPADARQVADLLREAADTAERTPTS